MHIDCKNAAEMRIAGPILESKDMCAIFPKKGKKKRTKFEQKCTECEGVCAIACDYCLH